MIYITLYWEFFKIGLFAIGGGLASLPFLQDVVAKYGWITNDELLAMIAISESTPGPIGINVATFVGFEVAGVAGGIVATLGEVSPSVIVITLLAQVLRKHRNNPMLDGAFQTIRPVVAGLIGAVALGLGRSELFLPAGGLNYLAALMFAVILFAIERFRWHPVIYLGIAAVAGIVFRM